MSFTVSAIIPIHNEEQILEATTLAVLKGFGPIREAVLIEIILCENGSSDGTEAIARRLCDEHSAVRVISSASPDYGAAMRAGFLAAAGEFVVNFDADYYDFEFVRSALALDADIVIAAKNIDGSTDARDLLRRTVSRTFGRLVRTSLGISATETHGIKLYRRSSIEPLLSQVRSTKDLFDTELVARAERSGLKVLELPIKTVELRESRSNILRRIPRTVLGLIRLRRALRSPGAGKT
ncbi:MAG: glycosyltransferase family 2 protein [Actinomycetota bacterium]